MISYSSALASLSSCASYGPLSLEDSYWLKYHVIQIPTPVAMFIFPTLYSLYISALYLSSNEGDLPETVDEKPSTRASALRPPCDRFPFLADHKDPIHLLWRKVRESSDLQAQPWTLGPPSCSEVGGWVNSTTISPLWPNTMHECNSPTLSKSLFLRVCFLHSIRSIGDVG